MYTPRKANTTTIAINQSYVGEMLEAKVKRILTNGEPIKDGAPLIYTDRKDGVLPAYDPRTDRFDLAIDAMDAISRQHIANRAPVVKLEPKEENKPDGGAESLQATE